MGEGRWEGEGGGGGRGAGGEGIFVSLIPAPAFDTFAVDVVNIWHVSLVSQHMLVLQISVAACKCQTWPSGAIQWPNGVRHH